MTLFLLYLLGVIIATILIGNAISNHPDCQVECNGFVTDYLGSLLSWFTIVLILLVKADEYICRIITRSERNL